MWQFGTSAINTLVHWHKLGEVENECTSYNFRQFAIFVSKLWDLVEVWRSYNKNNFACFFLRHSVETMEQAIGGSFCFYDFLKLWLARNCLDINVNLVYKQWLVCYWLICESWQSVSNCAGCHRCLRRRDESEGFVQQEGHGSHPVCWRHAGSARYAVISPPI